MHAAFGVGAQLRNPAMQPIRRKSEAQAGAKRVAARKEWYESGTCEWKGARPAR